MTLSETATDRNGLHQIEMLGKEAHGMSQTIKLLPRLLLALHKLTVSPYC